MNTRIRMRVRALRDKFKLQYEGSHQVFDKAASLRESRREGKHAFEDPREWKVNVESSSVRHHRGLHRRATTTLCKMTEFAAPPTRHKVTKNIFSHYHSLIKCQNSRLKASGEGGESRWRLIVLIAPTKSAEVGERAESVCVAVIHSKPRGAQLERQALMCVRFDDVCWVSRTHVERVKLTTGWKSSKYWLATAYKIENFWQGAIMFDAYLVLIWLGKWFPADTTDVCVYVCAVRACCFHVCVYFAPNIRSRNCSRLVRFVEQMGYKLPKPQEKWHRPTHESIVSAAVWWMRQTTAQTDLKTYWRRHHNNTNLESANNNSNNNL